MPEAAIRIAIRQTRYTNGVASPENGIENCGLKNVETAGPMIAADITTAPVAPTASRRRRVEAALRGGPAAARFWGCAGVERCLMSDDLEVKPSPAPQTSGCDVCAPQAPPAHRRVGTCDVHSPAADRA